MDPWKEIFTQGCKSIFEWGPGLLLSIVMIYAGYKLVHSVGMKIVGALEKPTAALTTQADSMDRLTGSIQDYVARDRNEHREMIILLKVNAERLNQVVEKIEEMNDERDKKRAVS